VTEGSADYDEPLTARAKFHLQIFAHNGISLRQQNNRALFTAGALEQGLQHAVVDAILHALGYGIHMADLRKEVSATSKGHQSESCEALPRAGQQPSFLETDLQQARAIPKAAKDEEAVERATEERALHTEKCVHSEKTDEHPQECAPADFREQIASVEKIVHRAPDVDECQGEDELRGIRIERDAADVIGKPLPHAAAVDPDILVGSKTVLVEVIENFLRVRDAIPAGDN